MSKPIDTIAPGADAVAALGNWPAPQLPTPRPVVPAPAPTVAAEPWTIGMCANAAIVYRPGTQHIDHLTYCREAGTVARWSRPGTDGARLQHYCAKHAAKITACEQSLNERLDRVRVERGEEPLVWRLWDRVLTPDGPGYVVFLPNGASGPDYTVGLDSRHRGDRPHEYPAHRLTAA